MRGDAGEVGGATLVIRHFAHVAQIHFIVVDRAEHGTGVGSAMIKAIEAEARQSSVSLLEVKTVGASRDDPNYGRTRHFYEKMGFIPVEETNLWGKAIPCLIMVKPLV